jgi:hypothetical protein
LAANENSKTNTGGYLGPYHYEKSCSANIQHLAQVSVLKKKHFIKPKMVNPYGISSSNSWMKFISVEECQTQIGLENLDSIKYASKRKCLLLILHS